MQRLTPGEFERATAYLAQTKFDSRNLRLFKRLTEVILGQECTGASAEMLGVLLDTKA